MLFRYGENRPLHITDECVLAMLMCERLGYIPNGIKICEKGGNRYIFPQASSDLKNVWPSPKIGLQRSLSIICLLYRHKDILSHR
jgi:hypothetical protein